MLSLHKQSGKRLLFRWRENEIVTKCFRHLSMVRCYYTDALVIGLLMLQHNPVNVTTNGQ